MSYKRRCKYWCNILNVDCQHTKTHPQGQTEGHNIKRFIHQAERVGDIRP